MASHDKYFDTNHTTCCWTVSFREKKISELYMNVFYGIQSTIYYKIIEKIVALSETNSTRFQIFIDLISIKSNEKRMILK
jgi:hypothetical protein